jgi:TM2 domain-containing membrane protein YozV
MKTIKQLSLLGLAILLILNSCTIEKRVHLPGYHVEWKNGMRHANKQGSVSEDNEAQIEKNQIKTVEQSEKEVNTTDIVLESTVPEDNISASVDNEAVIITSQEIVAFDKKSNTIISKVKSTSETKSVTTRKEIKSKVKAEKYISNDGGGKSQLVALLLCILIGVLGIHRFYLGYTGIGILMLLTGGLCGILVIIDLIRILTGDLKPINGDYSEKL